MISCSVSYLLFLAQYPLVIYTLVVYTSSHFSKSSGPFSPEEMKLLCQRWPMMIQSLRNLNLKKAYLVHDPFTSLSLSEILEKFLTNLCFPKSLFSFSIQYSFFYY